MKFILHGRVVTMDANSTVIDSGAVYVDGNTITAVAAKTAAPPAGFAAGVPTLETNGTIYPGLIELHNHLSYDSLQLWNVPKPYTNRGQWQSDPDYESSVSAPMGEIAKSNDPNLLAAVARYAETKCLLGGVTTSQGISLKGENLQTCYRSAMRVVDDPGDPAFHRAATHIPDVAASDWAKFNAELAKATCLLLHLSEGTDEEALKAFLALEQNGKWAITPALAGIHCAALRASHFTIMAQHGASVVWSPLSNLMLYGGTTDISAARAAGLQVALGSDWSPSGSKNLLNELKVAKVASSVRGYGLTDQDIVAMVTSIPARIVKWNALVGSLAQGMRADFTVVGSSAADPYSTLVEARETDLVLVIIDGNAVIGTKNLMGALGQNGEPIPLGTQTRVVNYGTGDPRIPTLTFAQAKAAMADALNRLPTLLEDEKAGKGVLKAKLAPGSRPALRLALDEEHHGGFALRPELPFHGKPTGPGPALALAARVPVVLKPLPLDPPAVADDPHYGAAIQAERNIPAAIKNGLKTYF